MTDVTNRFSLSQIDHQELLAILTLRYKTCWLVSKDEISFPASNDYCLKLKMHHGQITKISSGESLSEEELSELSAQVEADLKDDRIAEYGAEILFARRPVTGAFRFTSVPMQILPPPPEAPRPPHMSADHPFVLEYPIRRYRTPQVGNLRRRKNVAEWTWVLNALLYVENYCRAGDVDQGVVRDLYRVRSALAHGHYLFQFDEAPFAVNVGATIASRHELEMSGAALTLAKEGARNWLLSKSNGGSDVGSWRISLKKSLNRSF